MWMNLAWLNCTPKNITCKYKKQKTTSAGEDVEKLKHLNNVGGNAKCTFILESNMKVLQKVKNRIIIWSSNSTSGIYPE